MPPPAKEPPIIMAKETPPAAEPDVKDRPNGKDILNEDDPMHDSFFKSVIEETPEAIYNHFKVKVKKPLEAKGGTSPPRLPPSRPPTRRRPWRRAPSAMSRCVA